MADTPIITAGGSSAFFTFLAMLFCSDAVISVLVLSLPVDWLVIGVSRALVSALALFGESSLKIDAYFVEDALLASGLLLSVLFDSPDGLLGIVGSVPYVAT